MITIRKSDARGQANFGWLDSQHSFSFGSYYDPRHMGFGDLRVINQDRVAPAKGFGAHGHRNMEIISYVLEGDLAHRDSTGSSGVIRPGDVQVMSAGRGIRHSEMNGRDDAPVRFLQIWIVPAVTETEPGYTQRNFARREGLTLLVSPDGRDGSLPIKQDAMVYRALLSAGARQTMALARPRAWVQVITGALMLDGQRLVAGDGAAISAQDALTFEALEDTEALVFELR